MRFPFVIFSSSIIYCIACTWLASSPILAQPSLIETMQQSMPAIISIAAEEDELFRSPQGATIDPKTGRMVVFQKLYKAKKKIFGAGVIVDPSGLIVTNTHTILNAQKIFVILNDGTTYPAQVLGVVSQYDFAFLKINPSTDLQPITFADSDKIQLGDEIVTIGNSSLLKETISGGKIIGIGVQNGEQVQNKEDLKREETKLIQVDINVYKGDSGGPLFNRNGEFIGLFVAGQIKADRSSFVIPSNKIKEQAEKYIQEP